MRLYVRSQTPREHAANDVLVTGTFDNWQKTVTLEKENGVFKKTVELPKVHTQYKVRTASHRPCGCRLASAGNFDRAELADRRAVRRQRRVGCQ